MNSARIYVAVAAGSALGAMARFLLAEWVPYGTLPANGLGSFLIGLYAASALRARPLTSRFVMDGFCGGFTTFSLFSLELLVAMSAHAYGAAMAHIGATLAASIGGVWLGWVLGSAGRRAPDAIVS